MATTAKFSLESLLHDSKYDHVWSFYGKKTTSISQELKDKEETFIYRILNDTDKLTAWFDYFSFVIENFKEDKYLLFCSLEIALKSLEKIEFDRTRTEYVRLIKIYVWR